MRVWGSALAGRFTAKARSATFKADVKVSIGRKNHFTRVDAAIRIDDSHAVVQTRACRALKHANPSVWKHLQPEIYTFYFQQKDSRGLEAMSSSWDRDAAICS